MRWLLPLLLTACSTMNAARPLRAGEHAAAVTVGGALIDFGGTPVPLPNAVVETAHGLPELASRPFDLRAGLNVTALPFGLVSGHVGAAWGLAEPSGNWPALSLSNRVFFATNVPGPPGRPDPTLQAWGADQIELLASYDVGRHLVYGGVAQVFDLRRPQLLLCPSLGASLSIGRAWSLQPELRWYAAGRRPEATAFHWVTDRGALGVSLGVARRYGRTR